MELTHNNKTITLRDNLFWDVSKFEMDPTRNAQLIIERVLTRGNKYEFADVYNFYGRKAFIKYALQIKVLDKKTANFLSNLFRIKKENFKCYSTAQ